jgi:hypothetical protein
VNIAAASSFYNLLVDQLSTCINIAQKVFKSVVAKGDHGSQGIHCSSTRLSELKAAASSSGCIQAVFAFACHSPINQSTSCAVPSNGVLGLGVTSSELRTS